MDPPLTQRLVEPRCLFHPLTLTLSPNISNISNISSKNDDIIPYEEGREIFSVAAQPKQFLEMTGGHNDDFIASGRSYINGLKVLIRTSNKQKSRNTKNSAYTASHIN